ncbi:MAG TPA: hypothetical protein VFD31_10005, partial [Thermoleophilaceae bacterium]|nr:hypothetical protein [Thermoleophilaceae bacterium]
FVPPELHAQVFTTAAGIKVGTFSAGSALAGPVVLAAGSAGALLIAAGMQFLAAGLGFLLMRVPAGEAAPAVP